MCGGGGPGVHTVRDHPPVDRDLTPPNPVAGEVWDLVLCAEEGGMAAR